MEEYKQRLKRQNVLLWVGIILLAALDVLLGIFWDNLGFLDTRLMTSGPGTCRACCCLAFWFTLW